MSRLIKIWMAACLLSQLTISQSEFFADDNESKTIDHWIGVAEEMARAQRFVTLDAPVEELKLRNNAIFRHTQSVRGDDIGAMENRISGVSSKNVRSLILKSNAC